MNIAVLTLTRDRLAYTQHCFPTLKANAGCDFDWYVVDQGSTDGTPEWLETDESLDVTFLNENIGICPALNLLLDEAVNPADYDVLVRFDNDCEVLHYDTLRVICELAVAHDAILAPKVLGLNQPPPTISQFSLDGYPVDETAILGGIFMAVPARLYSALGYRYNEQFPAWTGDEDICRWWRDNGGHVGYVTSFQVNHYLTSRGQEIDNPVYLGRKLAEMH